MEKQNPSVSKRSLFYGVLLGGILIGYSLIGYLFGLSGNNILDWIQNIVIIVGLGWSIKHFRDRYMGGYLEFGQGFGLGALTSIFGGTLVSVYNYVLFKYIDSSLLQQLKDTAIEEAMQRNSSEAELEMMDKILQFVYTPGMFLIGGILAAALGGIVISLILAAILKKPKPLFEEATQE